MSFLIAGSTIIALPISDNETVNPVQGSGVELFPATGLLQLIINRIAASTNEKCAILFKLYYSG